MDSKVFVLNDHIAVITCAACGRSRSKSVAKFKGKINDVNVNCKCGNRFKVTLNFRQHYRKEIELPGQFLPLSAQKNKWREMVIKDISWTGIGMVMCNPFSVEMGDVLMVTFCLDDLRQTSIEKPVIVRVVKDKFLGCEFAEKELYEKALGFYLRN